MKVSQLLEGNQGVDAKGIEGIDFSISLTGDGGLELAVDKLAMRDDLMWVNIESISSETTAGDVAVVKELITSFKPVNDMGGHYTPPRTGTDFEFYLWAEDALEFVGKFSKLAKTLDAYKKETAGGAPRTRWTWQINIETYDEYDGE